MPRLALSLVVVLTPGLAAVAGEPAPPKPSVVVDAAPGRGVTVATDDGRFSLNLRARIQLRLVERVLAPDDAGDRELEQKASVQTARLVLGGTLLTEDLRYRIQLAVAQGDFRDGATSPLYDAYLDYAAHTAVNVRAGQFLVPFDRLRTLAEFGLELPDRPRPVQELTLDRDVGVDLSSPGVTGPDSVFGYHLGVFGGGGIHALAGKPPGALFVGRLELRPFGAFADDTEGDLERRPVPGILIGAGAAYDLNSDRVRSTTGATFVGGTTDYLHLEGDVMLKVEGFALGAEILWRHAAEDAVVSAGPDGAPVVEPTRSGLGYVVQASYVTPVDLQVVGRWSELRAADGTDPAFVADVEARGHEVGAGLTYYVSGHRLKVHTAWTALFGDAFARAEHLVVGAVDASF